MLGQLQTYHVVSIDAIDQELGELFGIPIKLTGIESDFIHYDGISKEGLVDLFGDKPLHARIVVSLEMNVDNNDRWITDVVTGLLGIDEAIALLVAVSKLPENQEIIVKGIW